jgi:hypothetical protein
VPAAWGLQPTSDGSFHERRRIRDEGPIVFMTACMTLITLQFLLSFPKMSVPANLFAVGFMAAFWWFLSVHSTDIRLDGHVLQVRRGLLRRRVPLERVHSVFAERAGVVKTRIVWVIATMSTPYTACRVRLRLDRGRSVYLKSVEPKHLLRALDQALPPSVPRTGKAWHQFGVRAEQGTKPADGDHPGEAPSAKTESA